MNICFLINQLAPGGAPTLLLDIVRHTDADADIEYTICFIEGEDTLAPDFEAAGARVVKFDAKFKFDPRAIYRLARFFRREHFDILHAHLSYSQALGRIFGRLGDIECIVSTQHDIPSERHPITRALEQLTRPLDSATVAVAGDIERTFTNDIHRYDGSLDGQWCTIYNGVDVKGLHERVQTTNQAEFRSDKGINGSPVFLSVGRYDPAKAQHDLIKAMDHLVDELPDAKLLIVGWGELEDSLQSLVKEHDLTENVSITGRVSPRNIHNYYAIADVFVSSSIREGLPIVILEAMSASLPIVATNIPGVCEVVEEEETGLLVPTNSPKELSEAMIQVEAIEEPFGDRGYDRALNGFDVRRTVQLHLQLYRELLANA